MKTPTWSNATLADAVDIIRGITFPSDAKAKVPSQGAVGCLRTTNVQREVEWDDLWYVDKSYVKREEQYIKSKDILISNANSLDLVGKVALVRDVPIKATLGTFITAFRTREGNDARFVYFQLASPKVQQAIRFVASTTTNISNVSTKKLAEIELRFPPLNVQKEIVAEIEKQFTRLDAGVTALKRVQANLKRYRAAVLKAACEGRLVPTEAVLARAEGRTYETGAQLLERILQQRRKVSQGTSKESPAPNTLTLSSLPVGWAWGTVAQISESIVDCPHSTAKFISDGEPCVDTTCIKPGRIVRDNLRFVSKATYKERVARLIPQAGDIIYAREGTVGTAVVIPEDLKPCLGQRVMLMRSDKCVLPRFFEAALNSEIIRRQYLPKLIGSTVAHLNVADVKLLAIPLPPLAEQKRIVEEVERRLSVLEEMETAVQANLLRATRLRQAVLQRAFSGEMVAG